MRVDDDDANDDEEMRRRIVSSLTITCSLVTRRMSGGVMMGR
jgi:hypothetical protein